jgi:hypothetical protein
MYFWMLISMRRENAEIGTIELMKLLSRMNSSRVALVFALAVSLIVSFGLHTVEMNHMHPGVHHAHHESEPVSSIAIDEYFHGIEQKFFLLVLLGILLTLATFLWITGTIPPLVSLIDSCASRVLVSRSRQVKLSRTHYLLELFRKGILHSKAH